MLQLSGISKSYRANGSMVEAIKEVSLDILPGEFISLIGPSGSGKSTLLLMVGGMLSPTKGHVILDGKSLYEMDSNERARIRRMRMGFVFQTFHLIPYLTAWQNVQLPLLLSGLNEKEQRRIASSLLERMGLANRLEHLPAELSVGQQQRVALARTLANDPDYILADEPTGNLDPEMSRQVMHYLKKANEEGKTIIMVTHDHECAREAKKTYYLEKGALSLYTHSNP